MIRLFLLLLMLFIRDEHGVYVCVIDQYMRLYFNPTYLSTSWYYSNTHQPFIYQFPHRAHKKSTTVWKCNDNESASYQIAEKTSSKKRYKIMLFVLKHGEWLCELWKSFFEFCCLEFNKLLHASQLPYANFFNSLDRR